MPVYHKVSAVIHVDGRALDEYQVEYVDSHKLVSCWIPSQVGKEFSIQIRNNSFNDYMKFKVRMDGDCTNIRRIAPQATEIVNRCRPTPTTYRSFVFSQDDDEVSVNLTHVARVGTITIKVITGTLGDKKIYGPEGWDFRDIRIPETREIPERQKKGIDTCVALGPVKSRAPQKMWMRREFKTTVIHAKFVFRYRPLDFLQAQGIAPPPLTTFSNDRPRENNARKRKRSSDEVRSEGGSSKATRHINNRTGAMRDILEAEIAAEEEDLERLRTLRSKIDQILAENDPEIRPKKEHKPVVFAKGEVIDLT